MSYTSFLYCDNFEWYKKVKDKNIHFDKYSFYFTKDYFGMSVDVPHTACDYAELEIKYNDIKDNIKPENEVWKDFID